MMLVPTVCLGATDPERDVAAAVVEIRRPLSHAMILYHWTSWYQGLKMERAKEISESLLKKLMDSSSRKQRLLGPGLYVDSDPVLWSFVTQENRGSLLEVIVSAGTPYVDLNDADTLARIRALSISTEDFEKYAKGIVLFHRRSGPASDESSTAVATLRLRENIVIRPFTGEGLDIETLQKLVAKMDRLPGLSHQSTKAYFRKIVGQALDKKTANGVSASCREFFRKLIN